MNQLQCRFHFQEVVWTMLKTRSATNKPSVICLPVHLHGEQTVTFDEYEGLAEVVQRAGQTMLTRLLMEVFVSFTAKRLAPERMKICSLLCQMTRFLQPLTGGGSYDQMQKKPCVSQVTYNPTREGRHMHNPTCKPVWS